MDKLSLKNKDWKDFYLSDFFDFEKGNQNNMASLTTGTLPLVSAKKTDNGYKGFVSKEQKKIFRGDILTLNNDGDGGAGIAYYQPTSMALDSHVSALIPKSDLNKYHLLLSLPCLLVLFCLTYLLYSMKCCLVLTELNTLSYLPLALY